MGFLAVAFSTTLSITLNALNGSHVSDNATQRVTFAPLPLVELESRAGRTALHLEGLPSVAIGVGSGDQRQTTRLGVFDGALRQRIGAAAYVGIGTTIYNQQTAYPPRTGSIFSVLDRVGGVLDGIEVQSSRVVGTRFEAGTALPAGAARVTLNAAYDPRMHGVQHSYVPAPFGLCGRRGGALICSRPNPTLDDGENASQVDVAARWERPIASRTDLLLGVRYLNFVARYDAQPGLLADRNAGFMPVLGLRVRL